jgi:hypothetical protein
VKRKRFPVEQIVAIRQAGSQCRDLACSTTAGELTLELLQKSGPIRKMKAV